MQYCPKCATKTELKEFKTFSYYWCPTCKDEVKETKAESIKPDDQLMFPSFQDTIWFTNEGSD